MGKENKATMTLHFTNGTDTAANASAYQVTGGEWASGTIQWSNKLEAKEKALEKQVAEQMIIISKK